MDVSAHHKFLYRSFLFLKALLVLIINNITALIGFLANAVDTSEKVKEGPDSLSRGVLNYRTGKLDDGTDPYGWYEND